MNKAIYGIGEYGPSRSYYVSTVGLNEKAIMDYINTEKTLGNWNSSHGDRVRSPRLQLGDNSLEISKRWLIAVKFYLKK